MVHFMHLFSPWQNTNLLCPFGLTKTFTCVQLSNTYLSATLTTATFPTAAACRGFDASACTPTPRDLLSSHWHLRLHFIWKGSQLFIYRCEPSGTRTCSWLVYIDVLTSIEMMPAQSRLAFTCLRFLPQTSLEDAAENIRFIDEGLSVSILLSILFL